MNNDDEPAPAEAPSDRDAVMHALLQGLHEGSQQREARIARLVALHTADVASGNIAAIEDSHAAAPAPLHSRSRSFRYSLLAIATALLLVCGTWLTFLPSSAEAALSRAAKLLELPVTRVYDVRFSMQDDLDIPDRDATLYSQSSDRFVLDFQYSPIQPLLIGANPERRWMRVGRRTFFSDGEDDQNFPRAFVLDRIMLRQMQFNELLTSLPDDYDLRWLNEQNLNDGEQPLRRLEATRRYLAPSMPTQVVVWFDSETDLARRVEVTMRDGGPSRIQKFVATYREARTVDESFFQAESY